jgi:hypothetical protein
MAAFLLSENSPVAVLSVYVALSGCASPDFRATGEPMGIATECQ